MDLFHYSQLMQDAGEKATFEAALRSAIVAAGADEGSLLLPVENFSHLEFAMCCTKTGSNSALIGQRVPVSQGLVGMAAQSGETQIGAPTYKGVKQAAQGSGAPADPTSVLASPLIYNEQVIGVMTLVSFDPGKRFTMDDALHYEALASLMALLLHKQAVINELEGKVQVADPDSPHGKLLAIVGELADASPERVDALVNVLKAIKGLG